MEAQVAAQVTWSMAIWSLIVYIILTGVVLVVVSIFAAYYKAKWLAAAGVEFVLASSLLLYYGIAIETVAQVTAWCAYATYVAVAVPVVMATVGTLIPPQEKFAPLTALALGAVGAVLVLWVIPTWASGWLYLPQWQFPLPLAL